MFENLGLACEILITDSDALFNSIKWLTDILTLTDKVRFIHTKQHFEPPQIKQMQVEQFEQQRNLRYSVIYNEYL